MVERLPDTFVHPQGFARAALADGVREVGHRREDPRRAPRAHWRKDVGEPGAKVALTERTVDRLEALRLVRRTDEGVVPLPALGRYALDPMSPLLAIMGRALLVGAGGWIAVYWKTPSPLRWEQAGNKRQQGRA